MAYLANAVAGRNILDVGVVAHTREATEDAGWLQGHLRRSASKCLGIAILADSVAFLQSQAFNIRLVDIAKAPLSEKFEVIVAGEVLEHLGAPGRFMDSCAAMLGPNGRLLVTVPNPCYLNAVAKNFLRRTVYIDSADHVAWYDPNTIYELGQRSGLELVKWSGIAVGAQLGLAARCIFGIAPVMIARGLAPEVLAKSILYEFVREC